MKKRRFLYCFIDGCGMGSNNPEVNPLAVFGSRFMKGVFPVSPFVKSDGFETDTVLLTPVAPLLSTPGLPQSATGQTALFSGIDPCPIIGRHLSGFPTEKLAAVIEEHSLLKVLAQAGFAVTSANAYSEHYFQRVKHERWLQFSATTVAIMAAGVPFRMLDALQRGEAVFHDITHRLLIKRCPDFALCAPEAAGENLARVVMDNDFTLFEYFLTDLVGHRDDKVKKDRVIEELELFLSAYLRKIEEEKVTTLIVSDHGNLEDNSVRTHTRNHVPCLLIGSKDRRDCFRVKDASLEDVYHMVLKWFAVSK